MMPPSCIPGSQHVFTVVSEWETWTSSHTGEDAERVGTRKYRTMKCLLCGHEMTEEVNNEDA